MVDAHPVTGQWLENDGTRWWFDSGSIALDFAYAPEGLGERYADAVSAPDDRTLTDAVALRSVVLRSFEAVATGDAPTPDDVDTINLFAATPDIPPALDGGRRQAGRALARPAQALSEVARDAVRVLSGDPERIRSCAADDCSFVFHDDSRAGTRRWCSMQRCGNRAKVRAHRAR